MANNAIALLAQVPKMTSGSERETNNLNLQALRDQAAARAQGIADEAAVREVYKNNADPAARVKALYSVSPKAAMADEKFQVDTGKDRAETAQKQQLTKSGELADNIKKMDQAGQAMGYVMKNPTLEVATRALDELGRAGIYSAEAVAHYKAEINRDPSQIASLAEQGFRGALAAKDQLSKQGDRNLAGTVENTSTDPVTGKVTVTNTARVTQSPDNAASNATQRRGQDLQREASIRTDARQREANETAGANSRGVIIQTDSGPMLANPRDGTTRQIMSPDGKTPVTRTKPLTEFQGKSAAFGDRAMASDKILNDIPVGSYSPSKINAKMGSEDVPVVGGMLGSLANLGLSETEQRVEQAQRDFINAVLRQESGAAIGPSEFANAKKQYFPQPNDKPANIAQKARNRKLVIEGFKRSAGANAEFTDSMQQAASNGGWTVTETP